MEFDDYVSCDANVRICEIQSVHQAMQDHLRRRRGGKGGGRGKGGGGGGGKGGGRRRRRRRRRNGGRAYSEQTKFFDALQGLEAARRHIQQFNVEDNIVVMRNKLENKLYTLKHQEKHKQITIFDWLKKTILF